MAPSNSGEMNKLLSTMNLITEAMGSDVSVERVRIFTAIAKHCLVNGKADQNELARELEILVPTMSRNVGALSDAGDRGREALGLVEVRFDPLDRRRRMLTLSTKGEQLVKKLNNVLGK